MQKISQKQSMLIYEVKTLAVISIVMAHSSYTMLQNEYMISFLGRFCRMGVFTFLLLAGYFYNCSKEEKFSLFWKKKATTLLLPWFVSGTIMYGFQILQGQMGIKEYVNFLLGNGSSLYYMTVLCMLYVIFWPFKDNDIFLGACIILTIASIFCTASGFLPNKVDTNLWIFTYLNPYLNLFNWCGIFALGIIFRKRNLIENFLEWIEQHGLIVTFGVLLIVIFIWSIVSIVEKNGSYFSYAALFMEFTLMIGTFTVCSILPKCFETLFVDIGKSSYAIYLYHGPVVSFLLKGFESYPGGVIWSILRPILVILILFIAFKLGAIIASKLKLEKIYSVCTGIR